MTERYNIRVYGLRTDDSGEHILVTDERRGGYLMTKFPGGGHEVGEGLADALVREWQEELHRPIEVGELFYVNEFMQVSAFDPAEQLISFYFRVIPKINEPLPVARSQFEFGESRSDQQTFRWMRIADLQEDDFTFPVDKVVAKKLKRVFLSVR